MKDYQIYSQYRLEDFIADPSFRKWVLDPSPDDDLFWRMFLMLYPQKEEEIAVSRKVLHETHQHFSSRSLSMEEKKTLLNQIHFSLSSSQKNSNPLHLKIAASIIILISLSIMGWWIMNKASTQEMITFTQDSQRFWLPDSSCVILNENSKLTYSAKWESDQSREVWLEGEGFFDIRRSSEAGQKFIVHTQDLSIKVLGTKFNVNSRTEETHVVLQEGKIELNFPPTLRQYDLIMNPGEMVSYASNHHTYSRKHVNANVYTSWKDGVLLLEKITLEDASYLIEDNFDIQLEIMNKALKIKEIQGAIPLHNKEVLLETLSTLFDIRLNAVGDTLWVYPK